MARAADMAVRTPKFGKIAHTLLTAQKVVEVEVDGVVGRKMRKKRILLLPWCKVGLWIRKKGFCVFVSAIGSVPVDLRVKELGNRWKRRDRGSSPDWANALSRCGIGQMLFLLDACQLGLDICVPWIPV